MSSNILCGVVIPTTKLLLPNKEEGWSSPWHTGRVLSGHGEILIGSMSCLISDYHLFQTNIPMGFKNVVSGEHFCLSDQAILIKTGEDPSKNSFDPYPVLSGLQLIYWLNQSRNMEKMRALVHYIEEIRLSQKEKIKDRYYEKYPLKTPFSLEEMAFIDGVKRLVKQ